MKEFQNIFSLKFLLSTITLIEILIYISYMFKSLIYFEIMNKLVNRTIK